METATTNGLTTNEQETCSAETNRQLTVRVAEEQHDWPALIPSLLERRRLECTEQTMESAQSLMDKGLLGGFTRAGGVFLSSQVEESLLESFVEDDYEGALHLTTLDDGDHKPVGFVFWREIPADEMQDWIDWENLQQKLVGEQQRSNLVVDKEEEDDKETAVQAHPTKRRMRESIRLVRDESVRWLEVACNSNNARQSFHADETGMAPLQESLTHSWVKLELLAVHPDYWNQHLGTLLLACAMHQAYQKGDQHMVLHVAGGRENVPARRLYDKFGFLPVPPGTVFRKPNKDLFVLGNVGRSLQRLCWPALEV